MEDRLRPRQGWFRTTLTQCERNRFRALAKREGFTVTGYVDKALREVLATEEEEARSEGRSTRN